MEEPMTGGKRFLRRQDAFAAKGRHRSIVVAAALLGGCLAAASAHDASRPGVHAVAVPAAPAGPAASSGEAAYLAENDAAMTKMMNDMAVKPTGDVDRDFVAMMAPHHQGAIDMAVAVLRYGRNEKIRRLAQEIIVTQQEEIAAMRLALDQPLPPPISSPTEIAAAAKEPHAGCDSSMPMHQEH
jgi:hypothetical protein